MTVLTVITTHEATQAPPPRRSDDVAKAGAP